MALNVVESRIMQISSYQDFDLKPDRPYKIYMAERNNYGIVLKPKTKILETTEELEDYSVDLVKGFEQPEVKTIGEGKLLEIGTRLTVANVQIKKIGETQISGKRRWRIITIENHEEEANVTLWGQTVTIGDTPEINAEINMNVCCVTTATFEGEKGLYSTPLTKFEGSASQLFVNTLTMLTVIEPADEEETEMAQIETATDDHEPKDGTQKIETATDDHEPRDGTEQDAV
ncbi:unnamed protein product [Mytilus edulis]|uniref:Uncharacterized protein n=1 Tax=Mytilus edulis TaxID=6550 RepID=A0A8S3V685_MYTED|nr:unnamed protein product [Mytilus edulis]